RPVRVVGEGNARAATANLFAKITLAVEPSDEVPGVELRNQLPPDKLPYELVAAAERGIRGALQSGEVGFPVINVRATILDGEMNQELSNEMAFEVAGNDAVNRAIKDNVVLLEPVMRLEVTVPEEHLGSVTGDLNARRAEIDHVSARGKLCVVEARIP